MNVIIYNKFFFIKNRQGYRNIFIMFNLYLIDDLQSLIFGFLCNIFVNQLYVIVLDFCYFIYSVFSNKQVVIVV